jgi:hypothetical protein
MATETFINSTGFESVCYVLSSLYPGDRQENTSAMHCKKMSLVKHRVGVPQHKINLPSKKITRCNWIYQTCHTFVSRAAEEKCVLTTSLLAHLVVSKQVIL